MADSGGRPCKRSRAWHRARWRAHMEAQRDSDLSAAAYCREHGLSPRNFYRWRGIFLAEDREECISADGAAGQSHPLPAAFAEVRLPVSSLPASESSGVEVVLAGGLRLRLERGFDADTLRAVVTALESLPC